MADRTLRYESLDDLVEAMHERNEKGHRIPIIRESIDRHGYTTPPEIDDRTGKLAAGHGRVEALAERRAAGEGPPDGVRVRNGVWMVPTVHGYASKDDAEAAAYRIASNQTTIVGGWIEQNLADSLTAALESERGLYGTGFLEADHKRLVEFLAAADARATEEEPITLPEPPSDPVSKRGTIWQLGPHRVMCGDSRDASDVATLLNGATINVAFTSPPYADKRDYDETTTYRRVPPDEYVEWFRPVADIVRSHLAEDGSWFVNVKPGADGLDTELYVLDLVLAHAREWGWHFATEFCWERNGVPKAVTQRFKNQFEPVYQFALNRWKMRPDAVRHQSDNVPVPLGKGAGATTWDGTSAGGNIGAQGESSDWTTWQGSGESAVRSQRKAKRQKSNLTSHGPGGIDQGDPTARVDIAIEEYGLAYPGNRLPTLNSSHTATGHAAAFPVGLPAFFIRAYSDELDVVYDPFVGSGSTILAAHETHRYGFGMEISPAYCDVICRRFQDATGIVPVDLATATEVPFA